MKRWWRHLAIAAAALVVLAGALWFGATEPAPARAPLPAPLLDQVRAQGRQLATQLITQPAPLEASVATVQIHHPAGTPLGGYFQLGSRRARAESAEFTAVAVALVAGLEQLVLVGLDTATVTPFLRARIEAESAKFRTPVLPLATHTHSGPGGLGDSWLESLFLGRSDPALVDDLARACAGIATTALAAARPVQLLDGVAQAPDLIVNRSGPGQLIDATVDELALLNSHGLVGRLVAFGAHPTLVADRARLDGDYPAALRRALLERGDRAPTLFVAGATGSTSAVRLPGDDPVAAYGQRLAAIVDSELTLTARGTEIVLASARAELTMPPPHFPVTTARVLRPWLSRRLVPPTIGVDIVRVGPVILAAIPGELSAEVTPTLRQQFARSGFHLVIASHNGQYAGYFMPAERYLQPGPEASLELYGPDTADLFVGLLQGILVGLQIATAEK